MSWSLNVSVDAHEAGETPHEDIQIKCRTAVEGLIKEVTEDAVVIEVCGHRAIMENRHGVKGEEYHRGSSFMFYVLKHTGSGEIFLSRNSIALPEALLKRHIPGGSFRVIKRQAGIKSIVEASVHVPKEIIRMVEVCLGGESLFLRRAKHGGRQFIKHADSIKLSLDQRILGAGTVAKKMFNMVIFLMTFLLNTSVFAFEFENYPLADLDALLHSSRVTGIVPVQPQKLSFKVSLASPVYACSTEVLKIALEANKVNPQQMASLKLSRCVDVWSPRGVRTRMFIQDQLTQPMMRIIPPGGRMYVFCAYLYASQEGPGLLINEVTPASARE